MAHTHYKPNCIDVTEEFPKRPYDVPVGYCTFKRTAGRN